MASHRMELASVHPQKKTVSAASVFKRYTNKATKDIARQPEFTIRKSNLEDAPEQTQDGNPTKKVWKVTKNRTEPHPLAKEYKETSDNYRRHLYKTTSLTINTSLSNFLTTLHKSTLHNPQDHPPQPTTSSAKLTLEANKLCQPISQYQIRLTRTNTRHGKPQHLMRTLETRMLDFEEHISRQAAEIQKLEKDWEAIVGEIWKLGIHVLGKREMEELLFCNNDDDHDGPSSPAESPLFVPERAKMAGGKKRVTFEALGAEDGDAGVQSRLAFLYQPSRIRKEAVLVVEGMSRQVVGGFEKEIEQLGKAQVHDLEKLEREHAQYWKKKTAQVALALGEDEV